MHNRPILQALSPLVLLVLFSFLPTRQPAPPISGAWERQVTRDGVAFTQMLLFSGNYFSLAEYKTADGAFGMTKGGSWTLAGKQLTLTYEFHTSTPDLVGTTESWQVSPSKKKLTIAQSADKTSWTRVDAGTGTPLSGAWLISGRKDGEQIVRRATDGPRKTMKMLTGTRFQWIAFNTATKEFFGTGGGTYTAKDGKYTENIGFFSRDNKRVGASLSFDFKVDGKDWHHSGLNSSGQPLYEVWSVREK